MFELYPHNQRAYENAKFVFENENRTAIVHATGTGKSLIIAKFIIDNPNAKCLFISPNTFIHREIKKHIKNNFKKLDFQTYQFFLYNSFEQFFGYDFIFLDEFHRAGAIEWNKQILGLIALNPTAKILGTSATHIRYLDNERNMVEELFENNISSFMTLGEAIEQGIHKKPIYISALYNIKEIIDNTEQRLKIKNRIKELENLKSRKVIWEESIGIDFIINKYLTSDRKKILIFCKSVEHLNYIQQLLKPIFNKFFNSIVDYHTIHSNLKTSQNIKIFEIFEHSKNPQILFSVDMLNEGIHVKNVDTIMMFRDTASPIIYFQQMGRCFSVGQKLNPLIFDFVNNFNIKNFVGSIVQNFYNNFAEKNDEKYYKKRNLILDFYDETLDFQNFINDFIIQTKSWMENYNELLKFKEKTGRLPKQKELIWLYNQKMQFKKDKLSIDKIDLLLKIDKKALDILDVRTLDDNLQFLKEFKNEKGKLPNSKESYLVPYFRTYFKKNLLPKEIISKLKEIDVNFFYSPTKKDWKESFDEFSEFYKTYKRIPSRKENTWIHTQIALFRKSKLSKNQIQSINNVNNKILKLPTRKDWLEGYENFKIYFRKTGKIGNWGSVQKRQFKNGKLQEEKINLLLKINENFFK